MIIFFAQYYCIFVVILIKQDCEMKLQKIVFNFLQSKITHYTVLFFILISIASIMASTYKEMYQHRVLLFSMTYLSSSVFLIEYVLRIFSAPAMHPELGRAAARLKYTMSFYGFVDFVAILPCLMTYFLWDTSIVHAVVLPYIFTIFKLIRHSRSFRLIGEVLHSVKDELVTAYTACGIMVGFSAILMYYIERDAQPDVFRNVGDGIWWSVVAFTTTGYGDIYPVTALGKLLGIIISMIGIAMIALPTGIVGSAFINVMQEHARDKIKEKENKK